MTIQKAIKQAQQDLTWHVTPNADVLATIRYVCVDGTRRQTDVLLRMADKAGELARFWLDSHESLDAALDSVLFVTTPKPVATFF